MNDKYVIKNCPACCNYEGKYGCEDNHDEQGRDTYCECITDCVMKQIVDKCKEKYYESSNIALRVFANEILQLLDMQEDDYE